jgi:hypothetical protein
MATQRTKKKKTESEIREAYITYVLLHGKKPSSVFAFCHEHKIEEKDFYQEYTSFEHIEEDVWKTLMKSTLDTLNSDEQFESYSSREKSLAFYFSFFQDALNKRSFITYSMPKDWKQWSKPGKHPMHSIREHFQNFAESLLAQGMESGEIANRNKLNNQYEKIMWLQFQFLLHFWIQDNSKGFEKTDAAIEKAVNVWFDLIERGALESALDFGKFIFQQAQ